MKNDQQYTGLEIAITGMACRLPGANNWRAFWDNLVNGVESIEVHADGNAEMNPTDGFFVKSKAFLKDKDLFDFSFFDYSPDEARLLNPVHRIFHQCVWEALEDAGYNPEHTRGLIALYAGAGDDLNWKIYSTLKNSNEKVDDFTLHLINNKDYLASLISYKLDLKGPSLVVNTACSTSLVAVSLACRALLLGETKIALAGGVTVVTKIQDGYFYKEGMIYSTDGHCRAFDKNASGTVGSEGAGIVVLKRLTDAINDGDHIYAIIKGTAVNNDGNRKVGYTAPAVEGQSACIRKAQLFAKVEPASISYVETHGTGTRLGDPIEITALNNAFNKSTAHKCAIGSVKTNIGHTDAAAGVAGLIKTALSLKYRMIPASLHFSEPNPEIDFDGGPFYVNTTLKEWTPAGNEMLRAGVSSFGIGGTNAHAILEQAPVPAQSDPGREFKLLVLSAKTQGSLTRYIDELRNFLQRNVDINLSDLSYTFQVGRKAFLYRRSLVYRNREDLLQQLDTVATPVKSRDCSNAIVFMFPGQGSQYAGMCRDLYDKDPLFCKLMKHGFSVISELTGENFEEILYPSSADDVRIKETKYTQPLLFLVEYSLAQTLMHVGVTPQYMIGHSIGEYVAACISGVFSFEDAMSLVIKRGSLMNSLPKGSMVSVAATSEEAAVYLNGEVSLAAVNGPGQIVLSGDDVSIEEIMNKLTKAGVAHVKLQTSHAFHSAMQDNILESFRQEVVKVKLNKPTRPFISNLTGNFITDTEAMSPDYWMRHLRETVQFSRGIQNLLTGDKAKLFVEVGAGHSLTGLLKQHLNDKTTASFTNLARSHRENTDDTKYLANRIGELWSQGVHIDWQKYYTGEKRNRISLPTYSFEPVQYATEVDLFAGLSQGRVSGRADRGELKDWLYYPSWKRSVVCSSGDDSQQRTYLLLSVAGELSTMIKASMEKDGSKVIEVFTGRDYDRVSANCYSIDPANVDHFTQLLNDVQGDGFSITDIVYTWGMLANDSDMELNAANHELTLVYMGMVKLVQALLRRNALKGMRFAVVTNCLHRVIGTEKLSYVQSLLLGLVNVLPQEYSVSCCNIDIDMQQVNNVLAEKLTAEIKNNHGKEERIVAYRHGHRWIQEYERNNAALTKGRPLKKGGVYLVTGGLGNVGFVLAKWLLEKYDVKLALTGRSEVLINGNGMAAGSIKKENWSRLNYLQGLGKDVNYFRTDICDVNAFEKTVIEIEETMGQIDGVIHTAGIIDPACFELIEDMTIANVLSVLAPKVKGVENLYRVFKTRYVDFVWLTSSVATVLGGLGYGAYSAANLYMDHFVSSKWEELARWKCIGLAEMAFTDEEAKEARNAMNAQEIAGLFEWSQGIDHSPVIIQTVEELPVRIHNVYHVKKEQYLDEETDKEITAMPERPSLSTTYIAPQTGTETKLQSLFGNFFGINMIGVEDSFFELGGDSLKAMILLKRIKKEFNVPLTLNEFFGKQNIREIAFYIDEVTMLLGEKKSTQNKKIVI